MNLTLILILMITTGIIGGLIAQFIIMAFDFLLKKRKVILCPWCTQALTKNGDYA
jgi:hypothetical protein